jgi:hypothetical protein
MINAITDFQMADLKEHSICIKMEDAVIPQRDQDSKKREMPGVWKSEYLHAWVTEFHIIMHNIFSILTADFVPYMQMCITFTCIDQKATDNFEGQRSINNFESSV